MKNKIPKNSDLVDGTILVCIESDGRYIRVGDKFKISNTDRRYKILDLNYIDYTDDIGRWTFDCLVRKGDYTDFSIKFELVT